jgi:outer membrane protein TolC
MPVFFSLLAGVFVMIGNAWAAGELLTVEKALLLAEKKNPAIAASQEREKQARARLDQAKAAELPTLAATILYQHSYLEQKYPVYIGGNQVGFAQYGFQDTYKAALKLSYLLYSGGAVQNTVVSKKLALESVGAESLRTRQAVANGVRKTYYDLHRARAKLLVVEEALGLAKEHLRQVEAFYRNGVVAKNEVLRVQVAVSDAELNRIRANNAVDVAWSALERAVGDRLKAVFGLPPSETLVSPVELPADPEKTAIRQRPEMKALDSAMHCALAMSRAAAASSGPNVVLEGETYKVGDSFFPEKMDDWRVSLIANWAFFDGGESRAKVREAKAAADELKYKIEDLKKQIQLEVSVAILNYTSSQQRLEVARSQVASAEEDYRMALTRYASQLGTNIDVLDARVALSNAKTQLVEAIYDTLTSWSDLNFAMGKETLN